MYCNIRNQNSGYFRLPHMQKKKKITTVGNFSNICYIAAVNETSLKFTLLKLFTGNKDEIIHIYPIHSQILFRDCLDLYSFKKYKSTMQCTNRKIEQNKLNMNRQCLSNRYRHNWGKRVFAFREFHIAWYVEFSIRQ